MLCCRLVELEAMEACEWLREAGFPQYSQLYRSSCTYKRYIREFILPTTLVHDPGKAIGPLCVRMVGFERNNL